MLRLWFFSTTYAIELDCYGCIKKKPTRGVEPRTLWLQIKSHTLYRLFRLVSALREGASYVLELRWHCETIKSENSICTSILIHFHNILVGGIQCPYSSDTLEIEKQRFSMFVDAVDRAAPEELGHAGIITKCYNPNVAILLLSKILHGSILDRGR